MANLGSETSCKRAARFTVIPKRALHGGSCASSCDHDDTELFSRIPNTVLQVASLDLLWKVWWREISCERTSGRDFAITCSFGHEKKKIKSGFIKAQTVKICFVAYLTLLPKSNYLSRQLEKG